MKNLIPKRKKFNGQMNLNGDDIIDRLSQVMLSRNGGLMIISSIVVHSILQRPMARLLRTTSGLFNDH